MAVPENTGKLHALWLNLLGGEDGVKKNGAVYQIIKDAHDYGKAIWTDKKNGLPGLPERILTHPVAWYGFDGKAQPKGKRNTVTLAATIGWLDSALRQIITGQAAILAAVKAGSEKQGIDPAELEKLISDAVTKSAGTYELRKVEDTK